jgi:serine phosphatase RsbU (regulator of sigma subunit)
MSDGFPELFNAHNEMLDYTRIKEHFLSFIDGSANQIAARLMTVANEWRGERPQDDDITFVVIKIL